MTEQVKPHCSSDGFQVTSLHANVLIKFSIHASIERILDNPTYHVTKVCIFLCVGGWVCVFACQGNTCRAVLQAACHSLCLALFYRASPLFGNWVIMDSC